VGSAVLALGYASTVAVVAIGGGHVTGLEIVPTLVVQGFGGALLLAPLFNVILSQMDANEVGMASGVLSTTQQVSGALGVAVIGVLFFTAIGAAGNGGTGGYAHGLAIAVLFNAAVAAARTALVFALPGGARRPA
jgi:hypothetical protein